MVPRLLMGTTTVMPHGRIAAMQCKPLSEGPTDGQTSGRFDRWTDLWAFLTSEW